jgi:ankyrin repeat protein
MYWQGLLLTAAVSFNSRDVLSLLLDHGASVNAPRFDGASLHIAAARGNLRAMDELLLWGADANLPDGAGWTALRRAILLAPDSQQARELLLHGGSRETDSERAELRRRLRGDACDKAYLSRARADEQPPPDTGVAAACGF